MDETTRARTASWIARHRLAGRALPHWPVAEQPADEDEAYAIQDAVRPILVEAGQGDLVGYKVGATTAPMQKALGLSGPAAGGILANRLHASGVALARNAFHDPGVECEIAVTLGRDLSAVGSAPGFDAVAAAVLTCHAAIELVDRRYGDFAQMRGPGLIADDLLQAGAVLGPPVAAGLDLAACEGELRVNGTRIGGGRGADLLGHPYHVVAWLALRLARSGQGLKAGQVILGGSVVPPVWLSAHGDGALAVEVTFDGLGTARVRFV